ALGPTNKTASISTDANNPAARSTTFDEAAAAYYEQAKALLDGGADLLLVETIFDTLVGKAAFFAILKLFEERGIAPLPYSANDTHHTSRITDHTVPLMASVTFIQASPKGSFTGQSIEAFWNSIAHVPLLSVGMNCAL